MHFLEAGLCMFGLVDLCGLLFGMRCLGDLGLGGLFYCALGHF